MKSFGRQAGIQVRKGVAGEAAEDCACLLKFLQLLESIRFIAARPDAVETLCRVEIKNQD